MHLDIKQLFLLSFADDAVRFADFVYRLQNVLTFRNVSVKVTCELQINKTCC